MKKTDIVDSFIRSFGVNVFSYQLQDKFILLSDSVPFGEPYSYGESLGSVSDKVVPSLSFLSKILALGAPTVILNPKVSFLFICGRDILKDGIVSMSESTSKRRIVLNDRKEIIGVCEKSPDCLKNYWNIGDYLKRDMN
jgi:ribosome biogenesis protein Nip4